jgi:hypothetical protein
MFVVPLLEEHVQLPCAQVRTANPSFVGRALIRFFQTLLILKGS